MACPHCRSHSSPRALGELHLEAVTTLLDGLARVGDWRVSLTGGEPSLWKPLPTLLAQLGERSSVFSVTTNGSVSSNRLLSVPASTWRTGTLKVSIDGSRSLHDTLRGAGSFDRAVRFLRHARPLVNRLCVNTTLVWDAKLWADELHDVLSAVPVDKWSIIAPVEQSIWEARVPMNKSGMSYTDQFAHIQARVSAGRRTPLTFLNYSLLEGKMRDVIYVDADGRIDLPGFLDGSTLPLASTTHIDACDAIDRIEQAVEAFERTGCRLQ